MVRSQVRGVGVHFAVIVFHTLVYYEAYWRHAYRAHDADAFQSSEMFAGFLSGEFTLHRAAPALPYEGSSAGMPCRVVPGIMGRAKIQN